MWYHYPQPAGSYIIVETSTGRTIFETFSPTLAARVNPARYRVMSAGDYLGALNRTIRSMSAADNSSK